MKESENMKKLRNRNIFEELRKQVTQIQDTTKKTKEDMEKERKKEYDKIIKEIFGD